MAKITVKVEERTHEIYLVEIVVKMGEELAPSLDRFDDENICHSFVHSASIKNKPWRRLHFD